MADWKRFAFSFDADAPVTCRHCGHVGRPSLELSGETVLEVECSRCDRRLAFYVLPTADDIRAAAADGVPGAIAQLAQVDERERFLARVDEHALRSPGDLAPVPGDEPFVLTWHLVDEDDERWFVLRVGDLEVGRELATYESGDRFREVVDLLVGAYGRRLLAVEPVDGADVWILGDRLHWVDLIERVNARLPGARG